MSEFVIEYKKTESDFEMTIAGFGTIHTTDLKKGRDKLRRAVRELFNEDQSNTFLMLECK